MPRPRHQGPRRHALTPAVGVGLVSALVTVGAVYAYDRVASVEPASVTVARDTAGDSGFDRVVSHGTSSRTTVGKDPSLARLARIRAEEREAARLARLAEHRAEERRQRAAEARERARAERIAARKERQEELRQAQNPAVDVRIGTFNVLGSQHTDADGPRRPFPPASVRTANAAGLVAKHGVDVLGTQELQDDQLRDLQARTGMAAYPALSWGVKETDNSILWDPGVFELVSASKFTITFVDRPRPQPIVRLRHLATGRELYVVNTHPSPGGGRYLTQRRNAQATLVSVVRDLQGSGLPVLATGDMNDRAEFYCQVMPPSGMSAPNGGSYGAGCGPPPEPMPVDWVVGSDVTWSGYWRDTTPVENRTSDHFFVSATARLQ